MASQEQLASLLRDDSDDSTSSSGSSSSDDSESISFIPKRNAHLSPPATEALPEPPSSSSQNRKSSSPPSISAKKRIRIGFAADRKDREGKETHHDKTSQSHSLPEVKTKEMGASSNTNPPLSDRPMASSVQSLSIKPKPKLPSNKKSVSELAFTENKGSRKADQSSTSEVEASFVVAKVDEATGGDAKVASTLELESKPSTEAAVTANIIKTRTRLPAPSVKSIRFPPMSSPGLLTNIPSAGTFRETVDPATGLATPAAIFTHAMSLAGYTIENRSQRPHRGSSVQRVVDDMFDSNVKFALHFPRLIPDTVMDDEASGKLMRAFDSPPLHSKKRRVPGFVDMAPKSLTIPYPEEYIQRRVEYMKRVVEREESIVKYQDEQLALDEEREQLEPSAKSVPDTNRPTVVIPPIPEPPSPPHIHDMDTIDPDAFENDHPLYPPKPEGGQSLISHLDKDCFHLIDGRYFGLASNRIADPNFCGPSAPGLHGLSLSGGTGLATANTGGGCSSTLHAAPVQAAASVNTNSNSKLQRESKGAKPMNGSKKRTDGPTKTEKAPNGNSKSKEHPKSQKILKSAGASSKKKSNGPTPTATFNDLRKSLEGGGEKAETLHECIVRSAVYASRCGKYSRSWRATDGRVYPDIGKAFRTYAKIKPCAECKSSNMDIYHCRLRRRHKGPDYDGGDSFEAWAPLFQVAMEELVIRGPGKVKPSTSTKASDCVASTKTLCLEATPGDDKPTVSTTDAVLVANVI